MSDEIDKEILIPEVLPPESAGTRSRPPQGGSPPPRRKQARGRSPLDRIANLFGPILSGLILDFSHIQPMRLPGFLIGLFLGLWFARACNLRVRHCLLTALACGVIGFYGLHRFMPIATIAGAWFAMQNRRRQG